MAVGAAKAVVCLVLLPLTTHNEQSLATPLADCLHRTYRTLCNYCRSIYSLFSQSRDYHCHDRRCTVQNIVTNRNHEYDYILNNDDNYIRYVSMSKFSQCHVDVPWLLQRLWEAVC